MHILFLTHYFPPEVNAPASRTFDNSKRWVKAGHAVTVITCAPNHPNGILYPGYSNKLWQWEETAGIRVLRVFTYLSANKGFLKRTLNYISYMISATLLSCLVKDIDVVVSTSPQFFCGMAGLWVSLLKNRPWILEVRDLWPESIIAVGAIKKHNIIRLLERIESLLYLNANHIVSLTQSFKHHIMKRGVSSREISVITNGADLERFIPLPKKNPTARALGLEEKFVVSYIGTHGMAHALDTVLKAANLLKDEKDILFMLIGDGAERENLLRQREELQLANVIMLPQQPKDKIPEFIAQSDACMVLLKRNDLFKTVLPSKIFEAMAMARPVILGVEGESAEIIREGNCGICIEPENFRQLADVVLELHSNPHLSESLGQNGRAYVEKNFDRDRLAYTYLDIIEQVSKSL